MSKNTTRKQLHIDSELVEYVKQFAHETACTQSQVIESALYLMFRQAKQQQSQALTNWLFRECYNLDIDVPITVTCKTHGDF